MVSRHLEELRKVRVLNAGSWQYLVGISVPVSLKWCEIAKSLGQVAPVLRYNLNVCFGQRIVISLHRSMKSPFCRNGTTIIWAGIAAITEGWKTSECMPIKCGNQMFCYTTGSSWRSDYQELQNSFFILSWTALSFNTHHTALQLCCKKTGPYQDYSVAEQTFQELSQFFRVFSSLGAFWFSELLAFPPGNQITQSPVPQNWYSLIFIPKGFAKNQIHIQNCLRAI